MSAPPKYELARKAREILARHGAGPLPGLAAMNADQVADLLAALERMQAMISGEVTATFQHLARGANPVTGGVVCRLEILPGPIFAHGQTKADALAHAADEWRRQVRMAELRKLTEAQG